jgi:hypothetical protein
MNARGLLQTVVIHTRPHSDTLRTAAKRTARTHIPLQSVYYNSRMDFVLTPLQMNIVPWTFIKVITFNWLIACIFMKIWYLFCWSEIVLLLNSKLISWKMSANGSLFQISPPHVSFSWIRTVYGLFLFLSIVLGECCSVVVEALQYKPERLRVRHPMRWMNFSIYIILSATLGPGDYSACNRNEYQKQKIIMFLGSRALPVLKTDSLRAIRGPIA